LPLWPSDALGCRLSGDSRLYQWPNEKILEPIRNRGTKNHFCCQLSHHLVNEAQIHIFGGFRLDLVFKAIATGPSIPLLFQWAPASPVNTISLKTSARLASRFISDFIAKKSAEAVNREAAEMIPCFIAAILGSLPGKPSDGE
jgi:hypothetical protein